MESIETAVKADQREQAIVSAGTHVISEPQDHSYPDNITQIMKAMHSAVLAEDFQTRESLLFQLYNHCVENPSLLSELSLELLFLGADDEAFRAGAKVLALDMDNHKYWSINLSSFPLHLSYLTYSLRNGWTVSHTLPFSAMISY